MIHPLTVNDLKQYDTLDFPYRLRLRELGFLALIKLHSLGLKVLLKLLLALHIPDIGSFHRLHRNGWKKYLVKLPHIPILGIRVLTHTGINCGVHGIRYHLIYRIPHALAVKHPAPLLIDALTLLIVHGVIFQEILSYTVVILLYLFLRPFYGRGQHLMLYLLSFRHLQRLESRHQPVRTEEPHEVVFKRNIKPRYTRISLTS